MTDEIESGNATKDESNLTFYGLALHRFAVPGGTVKLIGKRERGSMPHQVYEIELRRVTGFPPNRAKVFCDGKEIFSLQSHVNINRTKKMAVSALHRYLKELARSRGSSRRRKGDKREESEVKK